MLLVCIGRVLLDSIGVAQTCRLLFQSDTLFVEFKIFVLELLNLDSLVVVLFDFGHELVLQVHAELALLLESLLEQLVIPLKLGRRLKLFGNTLLL